MVSGLEVRGPSASVSNPFCSRYVPSAPQHERFRPFSLAPRWKFRLAYRESMFLIFFRHGWASIRVKYLPGAKSVWG